MGETSVKLEGFAEAFEREGAFRRLDAEKAIRPGQVWERFRGHNVGARFEALYPVEGFEDFWVVRSLTAKNKTTPHEIHWPTVRDFYRLVADVS